MQEAGFEADLGFEDYIKNYHEDKTILLVNKLKLAQKRNYFKFVLMGIPKPVDTNALTTEERIFWNILLTARQKLLDDFNQRSRDLGLNVIEPCWCGKRRKTKCDNQDCQKIKKSY